MWHPLVVDVGPVLLAVVVYGALDVKERSGLGVAIPGDGSDGHGGKARVVALQDLTVVNGLCGRGAN